ncbi:hypothetical protein AJ87_43900 [Rhizobium yanglingense]|nr:hypothetical protein AJ87_43900 [Rhizobium yanglingense]
MLLSATKMGTAETRQREAQMQERGIRQQYFPPSRLSSLPPHRAFKRRLRALAGGHRPKGHLGDLGAWSIRMPRSTGVGAHDRLAVQVFALFGAFGAFTIAIGFRPQTTGN